jgi:hypothetical protein
MRVFTKISGKLAVWQIDEDIGIDEAIKAVRAELSVQHRGAVLALVKY